MLGIRHSYMWTFTVNDMRRLERGNLKGAGINNHQVRGITMRNFGMADSGKCSADRTGWPEIQAEGGPPEPPDALEAEAVAPLEVDTKEFRGWRVSYCKREETILKAKRMRAYLSKGFDHLQDRLPTLTEARRHGRASLNPKETSDFKEAKARKRRAKFSEAVRRKRQALRDAAYAAKAASAGPVLV